MKTLNKIITYAASVMMVIAIVVCLMRGKWPDALLLLVLLMAEWVIYVQSKQIEALRKIGAESRKPRKPFSPQNVTPVKVEE